jgi:hypothetical protein
MGQEAIAKLVAGKIAPEVDTDGAPGARRQSDNLAARCLCRDGITSTNARRKARRRPWSLLRTAPKNADTYFRVTTTASSETLFAFAVDVVDVPVTRRRRRRVFHRHLN